MKRWEDMGVAVLDDRGDAVQVAFIPLPMPGLSHPPQAPVCAAFIVELAAELGARVVLLDGPQGWKAADNGLEHCRVCERELHTPAKTGLPGRVKPATYRPFVEFSIGVFDALDGMGWPRLEPLAFGVTAGVAVESFPTAAWRALGIEALPAKHKASASDIAARGRTLADRFGLVLTTGPTHDQLQALVSGLAGLAIEQEDGTRASLAGVGPSVVDGSWREGYIAVPRAAGWAA